jgi:hypothetical protein
MKTSSYRVTAVVVLALLVAAGLWFWLQKAPPPLAPTEAPSASDSLPSMAVAAASGALPGASAASAPVIVHPIAVAATDVATAASGPVAAAPLDFETALIALFGRQSVLAMFQTEDFARRVVATVDNLGRANASARLWPVNPTAGRFSVAQQDGAEVISADNGLRYTPFVLLVETVDMRQLVATYKQLYPRFQQAYEDLGYPKRYFNDRLVEVIDLLLATPVVAGPVKVRLPVINGPLQPVRFWVLYEFDDAARQSLSAGQKILLRMGPINARRLKVKLAEIRQLVVAGEPRR